MLGFWISLLFLGIYGVIWKSQGCCNFSGMWYHYLLHFSLCFPLFGVLIYLVLIDRSRARRGANRSSFVEECIGHLCWDRNGADGLLWEWLWSSNAQGHSSLLFSEGFKLDLRWFMSWLYVKGPFSKKTLQLKIVASESRLARAHWHDDISQECECSLFSV